MDVEQLQNLDLFAEFTDLCIDEGLEQDAESGDEHEHDDMPEGEIGDAEEDAEEDVVIYTPAPKPLKPLQPPFGQHALPHHGECIPVIVSPQRSPVQSPPRSQRQSPPRSRTRKIFSCRSRI